MKKRITPSSTTDLITAIKKLNEMNKPKEIKVYGRSNNSIEKLKLENNYSVKIKSKLKQYIPLPSPATMFKQNMTDRDLKNNIENIKSHSHRDYINDEINNTNISQISEKTNKTSSTNSKQLSQKNIIRNNNFIRRYEEEKEIKKNKEINEINRNISEKKEYKILYKRNEKNNNNIINNNLNDNSIKPFYKNGNNEIKYDELLIITERINMIIEKMNNLKNEFDEGIKNECYEYWIFYFNSSLIDFYTKFFHDINHVIVKSSNNLELFTVILTYLISIDFFALKSFKLLLDKIFILIKKNFYLILKQILNNIIVKDEDKFILYIKRFKQILDKNIKNELTENEIVNELIDNCRIIVNYIKIILTEYKNDKISDLTVLFNNISKLPNSAINEFFFDKIMEINNNNNELLVSAFSFKDKMENNNSNEPYVTKPSSKKYTLILDLDETLVCMKFPNNNNNGILHFRNGLFEFLDAIYPFYELISFTSANQIYSNSIIKEIESKKKYFSYNLNRDHTIIYDKEYVKDISKIGRDLDKMIIVDNFGSNFRFNKENGILIYPFYDETNKNDYTLIELKKILILIYHKNYNDIREGLKDFKDEIIMKVSCPFN